MKNLFFIIACSLLSGWLQAQSALEVRTFTLDNGLTVWLNEDHSQSTVFGGIVVKAGAKDSPSTGIPHYFEHIMFKGTDKIGTIDYASEKVYLDSIAQQYDTLAITKNKSARRRIQKEINRLSMAAAQYAIPNEFNTLISQFGGSGLNAATSYDYTFYYNSFNPQYISQWLELYSERLIHPVFRLFQSELETVYEEKNMHEDSDYELAFLEATRLFYTPHPYQYPIIGTTEHLKNPQLSEMMKFYEEYYVGGNMALILSGDFDSEAIIPQIREKFSRIKAGKATVSQPVDLPAFQGKETAEIRIPIPIVKMGAIAWRGIPANSPDFYALRIALNLLSNQNNTGYLDQLSINGKLMGAGIEQLNLNEAGAIVLMFVPKFLFQSYRKAQQIVTREIDRIKKGDFTEEELADLKLSLKTAFEKAQETPKSRVEQMAQLFTQGGNWTDYQKAPQIIDALTKEDITKVANRYFTPNYLFFKKKNGRYRKERVNKPDFEPIIPSHRAESSAYAQKLKKEAASMSVIPPRTIDFEKDVTTFSLSPLVTLYAKENPVNNIFELTLAYKKGVAADPALEFLPAYLNHLGTDSLPFKEFRKALQKTGGNVIFNGDSEFFYIYISGINENFDQTLALIHHFLTQITPDKKQFKQTLSEEKISRLQMQREPEIMGKALAHYVIWKENSVYLKTWPLKQIKAKGAAEYVSLFKDLLQTECNLYYSGKLPVSTLAEAARKYLLTEEVTQKGFGPVSEPIVKYKRPTVFFVSNPYTNQSIIYSYTPSKTEMSMAFRDSSLFFDCYFGLGMSSLIFQELREFRSFAYSAIGYHHRPDPLNWEKGSFLNCTLSTQADKTINALSVLDSLLKNMPEKPGFTPYVRQLNLNYINDAYPSFRDLPGTVALGKFYGYSSDPNRELIQKLNEMDMSTIREFYNNNIKNQTTCYIIVGNPTRINVEALKRFGDLKIIDRKKIFGNSIK